VSEGTVKVGAMSKGALVLVLALLHVHLTHHPLKGPPFDYVGLAAASAASWVGVPGPGEPLLIAAGILAANHKLDIVSVLLVAFGAASVGGIVGWLFGMKFGRAVLTARGPFRSFRAKALEKGDDTFRRFTVIAVFLAPTWLAGIHRVRPAVYVPLNLLGAALWAVGIGLGAYYVGAPIVEVVGDLGWVAGGGLVALVLIVVWAELWRRRRRRAAEQAL
jgi:membrane protein DedA with SNARE-associated domain